MKIALQRERLSLLLSLHVLTGAHDVISMCTCTVCHKEEDATWSPKLPGTKQIQTITGTR